MTVDTHTQDGDEGPDDSGGGRRQGLSRRGFLRRSGMIATATGAAVAAPPGLLRPAAAAEPAAAAPTRLVVTEGTNMAAAAAPDGSAVVVDLFGVLWLVPATGGTAKRLTNDLQDATQPAWMPDGRTIVFQSYRGGGGYNIWSVAPDGTGLRQLTDGPYDDREPEPSPDGTKIAFASDRDGSYGIHLLDVASGQITRLTDPTTDEAAPVWTPNGRRVVFTVDELSVQAVDVATGARETLATAPADGVSRVYAPSVSPTGRLAYVLLRPPTSTLIVDGSPVTSGEDVFALPVTWVSDSECVYTADGHVRRRDLTAGTASTIAFSATVDLDRAPYRRRPRDHTSTATQAVKGIVAPVLSPDSRTVAFRALNAIWTAPLGGAPVKVVDDGSFVTDPDWAPDGRSLVYASDREGTQDLWRHDLATGTDTRLTALEGAQFSPRTSPDGSRVAFQDQNGATYVLTLSTGAVQQVLLPLFLPGRPTWSPDGRVLALAAVKPFSRRFREGTSQIVTVDLTTAETVYTAVAPFKSLSTRGDDGPVWAPDGSALAVIVESVLWLLPVDGRGRPTGRLRRLTEEATDAPSWGGDSRELLYLNNGRLRMVPAAGGAPRTVPLELTYRRARHSGTTVVHVGRLWDGRSTTLREDVDLVVEGERITAVEPHRPGRAGTIHAEELTAIPGLVDMHVHAHLRGKAFGRRQGPLWLAYGITTIRSPGDPAYQAVEEREAVEAGARLGPRFFMTGEALDGPRVYYNFMRPLTGGDEQLARELSRVEELAYDLVKCYVRLPHFRAKDITEASHAAGRPVTSHYDFPAVRFGLDGMEHMGATNRLGYSQTVSRLGRSYQDVVAVFSGTGMSITPTLFTSSSLYGEDESLLGDPRTTRLLPPWELAALLAEAAAAKATDQSGALANLAANIATLQKIVAGGGLVIAGTDSPLDNPAVSLHMNLRAKVKYGLSPYDALTTATRNAARWLALEEDLGTLEPGRLADVALVRGDPLTDIRAAAAVEQVMQGGTLHSVADLLTPYPAPVGAAAAAARVAPAVRNALQAPLASAVHDHEHWWHGLSERDIPRGSCC